MKHLYIHIPFCHRRCSYCDFNTYANMDDRIEAYVDALCSELALRGAGLPAPARAAGPPAPLADLAPTITRAGLRPTIFFGGGTPTMLSLAQFERVLRAADAIVPLAQAEVTVEANPGTVLGGDYLRGLRALGVNRISMGVQSLDDPTLRVLGRIHTAAEARQSFEDARRAGFERINLDFIFGLPGQSLGQWRRTLDEIVTWGADHFSLYSLILEEGTPLHAQVTGGRISVPDDDASGEMYELAMERFAAAGYAQYEISNWARGSAAAPIAGGIPAQACHHNLAYWLNADYLAAGAGAHGHSFPRRYYDMLKIDDYIQTLRAGQLPTAEVNELTERDLRVETMFMGLRLNTGVSEAHFRDRCGLALWEAFGPTLDDLIGRGLLERTSYGVRLTERGRMLGNQVFASFV
ncbi:radical SAM family heme chaperone HemW [Chloroflexia bacterium SDU3-3]|nr:radical SAM family heme chaperone HemW [Chloroflexia bacterium SDU3-3]